MDITGFIVSERNSGLLQGDYGSYHKRLSRRLLSMRRRLGRTTVHGKQFTPNDLTSLRDISGNPEFGHLLILTCERAWAHAMHIRTSSSAGTTTGGIARSAQKHIISRLCKASKTSQELLHAMTEQESTGGSELDLLEVRAYVSTLDGACQFERRRWKDCLISYSKARVIYAAFLADKPKEAFKDILTGAVDPSLRYAAFKSQIPRSTPLSTVAQQFFPRSDVKLVSLLGAVFPGLLENKASQTEASFAAEPDVGPKTITWRSRTVELEDAAIALALASASTAYTTLSSFLNSPDAAGRSEKDKSAAYDEILTASQDAVDATKHAIEELMREGVGQSDKRMQALQITRTAVNYALIGWRIGRNRVLAGQQDGAVLAAVARRKAHRPKRKDGKERVEKPEGTGRQLARLREGVVLYDGIIQSIESVKELPGIAADEAFRSELQAKRCYFQALKCLSIARAHILLSAPKNALALLSRAHSLSSQSLSLDSADTSSSSPPSLVLDSTTLQNLHSLIQTELTRQHALVELHQHLSDPEPTSSSSTRRPLIETLDQYPSDHGLATNLVVYPPQVEPVPLKPIFLDVAWNYLEYPGRERMKSVQQGSVGGEKAKQEGQQKGEGESASGGKKGWFGFGGR